MTKQEIYDEELQKLTEIFETVDESKRILVNGLIKDAAFLKSENETMKIIMKNTGMVKIHSEKQELQKILPIATQYLKSVNSYATVIKTLNGILTKNIIEVDDDFDEFMNGE